MTHMRSSVLLLFIAVLITVLLSGCTTTFFGTVLVITFRDLIMYVGMALALAALSVILGGPNARLNFWVCFLLGLVLTPLAALIYCLVLLTRKSN